MIFLIPEKKKKNLIFLWCEIIHRGLCVETAVPIMKCNTPSEKISMKKKGGGDKGKAVCGKKLVSDGGRAKVQKMAIIREKKKQS